MRQVAAVRDDRDRISSLRRARSGRNRQHRRAGGLDRICAQRRRKPLDLGDAIERQGCSAGEIKRRECQVIRRFSTGFNRQDRVIDSDPEVTA